MNVEQLKRATTLVTNLQEYISTEQDLLESLLESLTEYQDFLRQQMRENRELRTTINVKSL